jgi:integrase
MSTQAVERLLSIKELTRAFNVSYWAIYRAIKNDSSFPIINIGPTKNYRIRASDFMVWLKSRSNVGASASVTDTAAYDPSSHELPAPPSTVTVQTLMDQYLQRFPEAKILERRKALAEFCHHFGKLTSHHLIRQELAHWFARLKQEHQYRDRTLRLIKSAFNHFFGWLKDGGLIALNPADGIKFTKREPPRKSRVILSKDEVNTILNEARQESPKVLYGYLMCLVHTGCRRSEIGNLKWEDVDFGNRLVDIKNTKNGVNRQIKMSHTLYDYLACCTRSPLYVCSNPTGQKLGRKHFDYELTRLKNASVVKKNWTAHDLRHSFAYNFLRRGGELYQLQAVLGHKTIGMTIDLYGHLKASDIDDPSPFD